MEVIVLIPALIKDKRQYEMVRVQSLLRDRLRTCGSDQPVKVHSCIAYDHVAEEMLDGVLDLDFSVKLFGCQMYPDEPEPTGIRRPTEHALHALGAMFRRREDVFVLRVIQDTVIDNAARMMGILRELAGRTGPFLAGGLQACGEIDHFVEAVGIPRQPRYGYVQGALMFARLSVWWEHYPRLPAAVTHYSDDSVMSQMVLHAGGELVAMPGCWRHCHDAPASAGK